MAHPNPRTQRLAMPLAKAGALTSTSLAAVADLSLQSAAKRCADYLEAGFVEPCGGSGVRHDPVRYRITEVGLAWLDRRPKPEAYDFTALALTWRSAA